MTEFAEVEAPKKRQRGIHWDEEVARLLIASGVLEMLERIEVRKSNRLRILAYHRIDEPSHQACELDPSLLSATPGEFAEQIRYLVDHFHLLSPDELLAALRAGRPIPPKSVMITIDDGYRDVAVNAWPVLQRLQAPAILFVPTDFMGEEIKSFWWDRLYEAFVNTERRFFTSREGKRFGLDTAQQRAHAFETTKQSVRRMNHHEAMALVAEVVEQLGVALRQERDTLTWQELRSLSDAGLYIGAHTCSHPLLSRIAAERAQAEIAGSRQALLRSLDRDLPIFAYPSGHAMDLHPFLQGILRESGFEVAMTMIEGHNSVGSTNPLLLKRVGMRAGLSLVQFRLALTGVYDVYGRIVRLRQHARRGGSGMHIRRDRAGSLI